MIASRPGQRGFSLLELLVAFSIMAMSLAILYRATGASARNVGDAGQYQRAVVLAESLMLSRDGVPESGWNESGQAAELVWSVQSAPFSTRIGDANPLAAKLHEIVFQVTWNDGDRRRQFELVTLLPQTIEGPGASLRR